MPRWDVWPLLKMKSSQTFWPMRCAVDYTYNRIGSFVPGITLILTAEYTTDMNEDSAMLFYNYTSVYAGP